jgi:hypothetical protein
VSALVLSSRTGLAIGAHGVCAAAGTARRKASSREVMRTGLVGARMRCSFELDREMVALSAIVFT